MPNIQRCEELLDREFLLRFCTWIQDFVADLACCSPVHFYLRVPVGGNRYFIVDTFKYAQEKLFLAGRGNPVYRTRLTLSTNDPSSEYTDVYDKAHHAIVLCCSNMSNKERKDYIDKIRDNPHLHNIVHVQFEEESASAAAASMETD